MKIVNVEAWLFHFPLEAPFSPSWIPGYTSFQNSAVIYRLTADDGTQGISAGPAFADEAKGPLSLLRAFLTGLDADDHDEVHARLATANRTLGARAWFIDVALWDIDARSKGRSIAKLLGGTRDSLKLYASTGTVRDPDDAAAHAAKVIGEGFQGIKIRPRHDTLEADVAMVRAVRESIGPSPALMVDANQAWRVDVFAKGPVWDVERAAQFARLIEPYDISWIEEPLGMYDISGYVELRGRIGVPIAAGELHGDPGLVGILMESGGVDIIQPDLILTGGISGVHPLALEAEDRGLGFAPHTWTNGVGLIANMQLGCATSCEWLEFPYDPPGWIPAGRDAMLTQPFTHDGSGFLKLPPEPGLGVLLDEEKLATYATPL